MRRDRELSLLSIAVRPDLAGPNGLHRLVEGTLDWAFVVERARRAAVLPALAQLLRTHRLLDAVPQAPRRALEEESLQTAAQNALQLRDVAGAVEQLESKGIPSVLLKGGALLAAYYPSVGARHADDMDLLVAAADHPQAVAVLTRQGFTQRRAPLRRDGRPASEHHTVHQSRGGSVVELHLSVPRAGARLGDFERLRSRAERVGLSGAQVAIPCAEDLLAGLCVHVVRYHRLQLRYLARHVADLSALFASGRLEPAATERACQDPEVGSAVELSLALRGWLGEAAVPPARGLARWVTFPSPAVADLSFFAGAALESVRDEGLRGLWFDLFPSPRHMVEEWQAPERFPALLPHYPRRLLRLARLLRPNR